MGVRKRDKLWMPILNIKRRQKCVVRCLEKDYMRTDTIAAIATAMSNAGIGIVRISGSEAVFIADRIFRMGKSVSNAPKKKLTDRR